MCKISVRSLPLQSAVTNCLQIQSTHTHCLVNLGAPRMLTVRSCFVEPEPKSLCRHLDIVYFRNCGENGLCNNTFELSITCIFTCAEPQSSQQVAPFSAQTSLDGKIAEFVTCGHCSAVPSSNHGVRTWPALFGVWPSLPSWPNLFLILYLTIVFVWPLW